MQRISTGLALAALGKAISLKADSESINGNTSLKDLLSGFINRNEHFFYEDPQSDDDEDAEDSDKQANDEEDEAKDHQVKI